jgi:hypothetical protein
MVVAHRKEQMYSYLIVLTICSTPPMLADAV